MFKIDLELITLGAMAVCVVAGTFLDYRQASNQDLEKKQSLVSVPEPSHELPISGPAACCRLAERIDLPCSVGAVGEVVRPAGCERMADVTAEVA